MHGHLVNWNGWKSYQNGAFLSVKFAWWWVAVFRDSSVYSVWLHMYSKCTCACLLCKKVVRPKPDQPDRLLQPCKERSLKLLQWIFQWSCIKMQPPTTWLLHAHQHALHAHTALPSPLPSTTLLSTQISVSKQACTVPLICIMLFKSSMQNYFA